MAYRSASREGLAYGGSSMYAKIHPIVVAYRDCEEGYEIEEGI